MAERCDVCKQEVEKVYVGASTCGPISFAYCADCLDAGAEPYGAVIAYLCTVIVTEAWRDEINPAYIKIVEDSLRVAGRTETEFVADCLSAWKECLDWLGGPENVG